MRWRFVCENGSLRPFTQTDSAYTVGLQVLVMRCGTSHGVYPYSLLRSINYGKYLKHYIFVFRLSRAARSAGATYKNMWATRAIAAIPPITLNGDSSEILIFGKTNLSTQDRAITANNTFIIPFALFLFILQLLSIFHSEHFYNDTVYNVHVALFRITPASAAVHVMAVCVEQKRLRYKSPVVILQHSAFIVNGWAISA